MVALNDTDLIERCIAGDERAPRELYERYDGSLRRVLLKFGVTVEDTDDHSQETWIRVFRGLSAYERRSKFGCWMYRIAVNVAREKGRVVTARSRIRPWALNRYARFHGCYGLDYLALNQAVVLLPPKMRRVLLLVAEGYSHHDIAVALGISEGTSKSQLSKARLKIKQSLDS